LIRRPKPLEQIQGPKDRKKVKESWRKSLGLEATTVYPAHGKPFSADVFRKALK
jgi:hypothetical protein